ncbi:equilibrative nucleoside transporter 3 isoform X2 [Ambystoma mexicanum]|uniref:equilibrative nucleoside transporter 3 isoform X2 n=1 Tax=Ambystoma mexicanum TaxID=8296 RepID=UPI0037E75BFF
MRHHSIRTRVTPGSAASNYFESYISISSTVPSVFFMMVNFMLVNRLSANVRVLSSLVVMLAIFMVTTVLVKVDTSLWMQEFSAVTLVCVAIVSGASSIFTSSIFGVTGRFPMKHSQAVISGQAMGGTICALASIVDLAAATSVTDSALVFFLTADIFIVLCIIAYLVLPKLEYSRYYLRSFEESHDASIPTSSCPEVETEVRGVDRGIPPWRPILKKISILGSCAFYVFFVSIIIFPTLSSNIDSVNKSSGSIWTNEYFTPFTCFLLYNFADWCGRQVTAWIQIPGPNSKILPGLILLRTVFIPLFVYCNYQPRAHSDVVLFQSDAYPVVFISCVGLSNGYLGSLAMMYGPKVVPKELAEAAGIMMAFFLNLGLALGSAFSIVIVYQI